jgi:beta-lactamase class A
MPNTTSVRHGSPSPLVRTDGFLTINEKDQSMFPQFRFRQRIAAGLAFGLLTAPGVLASDAELRLTQTIDNIEQTLNARVGLVVQDSASDWTISYRTDERFLMNSTFKAMLCGAVLERVDDRTLNLGEEIEISQEDILDYAPVTEAKVGSTMTIAELCLATVDMSDNTAANLLIDRLGGPQSVTDFLRRIGDPVSRLDRREPDINTFVPGDPRDTTTPAAMVATLQAMLTGDALSLRSRAQLEDWMSPGGVTGALIRASTPEGWRVADKSGSGNFNRNIVAMVTPPGREPYFIAVFLSDAKVDFDTRNAAVIDLSEAVMEVVISRSPPDGRD